MPLSEDQKELLHLRVGDAARALNEALEDAHRFGLRSRVTGNGDRDKQTVSIALMRPVELSVSG